MKRKLLWIVIVLVVADIAFVANARAGRSAAAHRRAEQRVQPLPLRAQQFYPMMSVEVMAPVQLPDRVLMPGQYTFTLVYNGHNVSITTTGGKFLGTYMVVPAYRRDATDGLVETADAPAGGFDRISTWFFPHQQDGYSFLYSSI